MKYLLAVVLSAIAVLVVVVTALTAAVSQQVRTQVFEQPLAEDAQLVTRALAAKTCACRCHYYNPSNPADPTGDPLCREPYAQGEECSSDRQQWRVEAPKCSALNNQECSPPGFRQGDPGPAHGRYADCGEVTESSAGAL